MLTQDEQTRLSRQCADILARLQQGPATNDELSRISRKYTSRISDLRQRGYVVICTRQDHKSGLTEYRLELTVPPLQAALFREMEA